MEQALDLISDFADKLCKVIETEGESSESAVAAEIEADGALPRILKRLAEIGFSLATSFSIDSYRNYAREDLPEVTADNMACRRAVYDDLVDRLLGPADKRASPLFEIPLSPSLAISYVLKFPTVDPTIWDAQPHDRRADTPVYFVDGASSRKTWVRIKIFLKRNGSYEDRPDLILLHDTTWRWVRDNGPTGSDLIAEGVPPATCGVCLRSTDDAGFGIVALKVAPDDTTRSVYARTLGDLADARVEAEGGVYPPDRAAEVPVVSLRNKQGQLISIQLDDGMGHLPGLDTMTWKDADWASGHL